MKSKIKQLGPWYQKINIEGIITTKGGPYSSMDSSIIIWEKISNLLSNNFKGANILDLGCNAGFYSIMAAKKGAKVIGIESNNTFFNQALFLKDYYEKLWNKKLDITYINKDIIDVIDEDLAKLGKIDYVFALAILYHIGKHKYGKKNKNDKNIKKQIEIIEKLSKVTNKFIVRSRGTGRKKNDRYYDDIFKDFGFVPTNKIYENWRVLILYEKI